MGGTRGHIAIVASNYWPEPTGVSRTVTEFAEFLTCRDLDVRVATAMPYYPQWRSEEHTSELQSRLHLVCRLLLEKKKKKLLVSAMTDRLILSARPYPLPPVGRTGRSSA